MNLGDHSYITQSFLGERWVHKNQFYNFISFYLSSQYCVYAYIEGIGFKMSENVLT